MVDETTWKSIWKKDGKTVEREFEHISADGKTFREIKAIQKSTGF